jgi:hypothetical protein
VPRRDHDMPSVVRSHSAMRSGASTVRTKR